MTVVNQYGFKVLLPRVGPDDFWRQVITCYAENDERAWRNLAMLALRVNANWPLEQIGRVFGKDKGQVSRCVESVKRDLRRQLQPDWDAAEMEPELYDDVEQLLCTGSD